MKSMHPRHGQSFTKLFILFFLAGFAALVFAGRKNLYHLAHLRDVKHDLITEDNRLVEENKALQADRDHLKTPAYLEKAARENLGMAKPNEKIYIVGESKAVPSH